MNKHPVSGTRITLTAVGAFALSAALGLSGCMDNQQVLDVDKTSSTIMINGFESEANSIIVKFRSGPSVSSMQSALDAVDATFRDKNKDFVDDRFRNVADGRLAKLDLKSMKADEAIARLQNHPAIEYAEPKLHCPHRRNPQRH